MNIDNPYGKHSFDDLDGTWHRYLKEDSHGRRKISEDALVAEAIVMALAFVGAIVGLIVALIKGCI